MAASGNKPAFIPAIRDFQTIVGRNALAHGFATFEKPEDDWSIVYREVKDTLTVKSKTFLRYLEDDVIPAFDRVVETSGFTDDEMHQYGREIAALAQ